MTTYHDCTIYIAADRDDPFEDGYYRVPDSFRIEKDQHGFYKLADFQPEPGADLPEGFTFLSDDEEEAIALLVILVHEDEDDPTNYTHDGDCVSTVGGAREWLVVTDERADELWDEDLDNYLDECVLDQLPEVAQRYFDRESWKSDAKVDGRAHSLARYDGHEYDYTVNDTTYYVYRQN